MKLRIELPWPDKALSPNARPHWARKSKAVKNHRAWAALAARAAMHEAKWPTNVREAEVRTTFIDPVKRTRDRDNHQAMCKSYLDGFADAGVVANDSGFIQHPLTFAKGAKRGVVIEISIRGER